MRYKGQVSYFQGLPLAEGTQLPFFECKICCESPEREFGYQRLFVKGKWYFFHGRWKRFPLFNPSYRQNKGIEQLGEEYDL